VFSILDFHSVFISIVLSSTVLLIVVCKKKNIVNSVASFEFNCKL